MIDRRVFIQAAGLAAALLGVPPGAGARPTADPFGGALDAVLVDRHLEGSGSFAAQARARGITVHEFSSDVAGVWMRDLEPRLRLGPVAIAGYTSAATWFCIDLLARDFGARTVQRSGQTEAVCFVISQSPGRRAALAPAAVRAQWSVRHA
jgi:hypothetical protein